MQTYARIDGAAVVELFSTDGDISQMFHPDLLWIPCADSVAIGHTWDGHAFAAPVTPAPPVPASVTMRQARLALLSAGMLSGVAPAIAALPEPTRAAAEIEWEFAATVERGSALTGMLASALGLTGEDLDALFSLAATL